MMRIIISFFFSRISWFSGYVSRICNCGGGHCHQYHPHAQGLVIRLNSFHVLIFFRVAMEVGRYFVNFLLNFGQTS